MKPPCRHTHPLIRSGTCPWCGQPIREGQVRSDVAPRDVSAREWNLPAMSSALDGNDHEARMMTVSNLLLHKPNIDDALLVLSSAMTNSDKEVAGMAAHVVERLGSRLTFPEGERFENEVSRKPNDAA